MSKPRKQLPLPDESSSYPSHKNRALPSLPSPDDAPPPPVPARPGGQRPPPPVPNAQKVPSRNPLDSNQQQDTDSDGESGADTDSSYEEMDKPRPGTPPRRYKSVTSEDEQEPGLYADAEEGGIYEEEVIQQNDSDQENYDEFEIVATTPEEKNFPAAQIQEVYDDFNEPHEEEEQQNYDDFEPEQQAYELEPLSPTPPSTIDEMYEAVPEPPSRSVPSEAPRVPPARPPPSVPAPPPAPSKAEAKSAQRPLPKLKESAPVPKGRGMASGPALDLSAIMNKKGNLRKVGQPLERQNSDPKDIKDYGDTSELRNPFDIFRAREKEKKPALIPSGIHEKMAMFEKNAGFNKPNQDKFPPPTRTPPRVHSPRRSEQNSSDSEDKRLKPGSRSPKSRSRSPDTRSRSPNTRSRSPFDESHDSTDSPQQMNSLRQALKPPTKRDVPHPVSKREPPIPPAKKEPPIPPVKRQPPNPPPKRDPLILRESSPPPPPIDRPPLPGNHPVPPPPTSSLPPPPVKKENYSQVNKPGKTELPPPPPEMNGNGDHNGDSDGEIYDEAFSKNDPMLVHDWYFGEIERDKGNQLLKTKSTDGTYLVRKSTRGGDNQPYTLMVMYNSHIYNLKMRIRNDTRFALGEEKSDEISFKSVEDLIAHHQKNDVILVHKSGQRYETVLKHIPKNV